MEFSGYGIAETGLRLEAYEVLALDDLVVHLMAAELGDREGRQERAVGSTEDPSTLVRRTVSTL